MTMLNANPANDEKVIGNTKFAATTKLPEPLSDLVFNEVESKNLRFRLQLMLQVLDYIRREQLDEQQAAKKFQVSPIVVEYLLQRKITLLSTDQLLNMLEHCGCNIYEQLTIAAATKR